MRPRHILCVFLVLLALPVRAGAQSTEISVRDTVSLISRLANEIESLSVAVAAQPGPTEMQGLKDRIMEIHANVSSATQMLEPELVETDLRLTQLGDVTEGEAADISEKRRELQRHRAEVDSAAKRGHLVRASANDLLVTINKSLAETFNRNIFEKVDSPLSPYFWRGVWSAFTVDQARLTATAREVIAGVHLDASKNPPQIGCSVIH